MKTALSFFIISIFAGITFSQTTGASVQTLKISAKTNPSAPNRIFLRHDGYNLFLALLQENSLYMLDTNFNKIKKISIDPNATDFNAGQAGELYLLFPEKSCIAFYVKSGSVNYLPTIQNAGFHDKVLAINSDVYLYRSDGYYLPIKQNMLVYHPFLQPELKLDSLIISKSENVRIVMEKDSVICTCFGKEGDKRRKIFKNIRNFLTVLPDGRIALQIQGDGGRSDVLIISPFEEYAVQIDFKSADPFFYNHVAVSPDGVIYYLFEDEGNFFVKKMRIAGELIRF